VSRDPGNYGSVLCSVTVPLTLVTPGDTKVATASCNYAVDIGSADDQEYQIGIEVGPASQGGNYQGSDGSDYAVVTVVKPFPGAVSGGGYAVNTASGGSYAGDAGKKTTFGFNVKNNKSGNNLQGHVNIIFRRGGHLYQIKTTSTTSFTELLFGSKAGGTAQIETKANLTDITNPLAPVSLSGGLTLKIGLTDNGEPGSSDTIAFTLLDGGTLLFSSNWNGSKTIEQLLGGGNLQAR
jgi:hypothetical protein